MDTNGSLADTLEWYICNRKLDHDFQHVLVCALQELRPRILSRAEIKARLDQHKRLLTGAKPVFIQYRSGVLNDHDAAIVPRWKNGVEQARMIRNGGYGEWFVFWTDRPTDEQMREVEWP